MDVVITDVSNVTKAALNGRLDTLSVNNVETYFTAGIVPKGQPTIVDLTNTTFVASLGIRMILSVSRALDRRGAKLALFGANPEVMEVLETTAISEIVPVVPTEDEAIAAVSA